MKNFNIFLQPYTKETQKVLNISIQQKNCNFSKMPAVFFPESVTCSSYWNDAKHV